MPDSVCGVPVVADHGRVLVRRAKCRTAGGGQDEKKTGEGFYNVGLLSYHYLLHYLESKASASRLEAIREIDRDLATQDYDWEILIPEGSETIEMESNKTRYPNPHELPIMADLQRKLVEQFRDQPAPGGDAGAG